MRPSHPAPLWLRVLACFVGSVLSTVFAFILFSARDALRAGQGLFLFGPVWDPRAGRFGIAAMIHASFLLALSSLCAGWLLSLGCCCMLRGAAPRPAARFLMGILRFMTAVPTVVYGFTATFVLVPVIRGALGGTGFCWLAAASMLALQGVPTMTLVMDGAMRSRSAETALTASALGMTPLQHLARVAIPGARRALLTAAVLGFGRALGAGALLRHGGRGAPLPAAGRGTAPDRLRLRQPSGPEPGREEVLVRAREAGLWALSWGSAIAGCAALRGWSSRRPTPCP